MLWVRTFSVFLPSLFNSSFVWPSTGAAHKPTSAAIIRIFFMRLPPHVTLPAVTRILRPAPPAGDRPAAAPVFRAPHLLREVGIGAASCQHYAVKQGCHHKSDCGGRGMCSRFL